MGKNADGTPRKLPGQGAAHDELLENLRQAVMPSFVDMVKALMRAGATQEEAARILRWGGHVLEKADLTVPPPVLRDRGPIQ